MSTPYNNIFERCTMKFKDYQLDHLFLKDPKGYKEYLTGFLVNAIPKFTECETDLSDRNDTTFVFTNTLSQYEEEVLACMIVAEWVNRELMAAEDLRRTLGASDYQIYSGANSLKEKRNLSNDTQELLDKLINKYDWDNTDIESVFG